MKKQSLLLIILLTCVFGQAFAQRMSQGMNYQAVARDKDGQVLADHPIFLKISLLSADSKTPAVYYTETQQAVTNKFGLFTLVIGKGTELKGHWSDIPWSSKEIWMNVAIKMNANDEYVALATTQLLAVPYAFYAGSAGTAESLMGKNNSDPSAVSGPTVQGTASNGNSWNTPGNLGTNPSKEFIGTADNTDLVLRTNAIERARIFKTGDVNIVNSATVGNNLVVKNNVSLNTVGGATTNNGALTVANSSATLLTGTLTVNGIEAVTNSTQSTNTTTGALTVVGGVGIGKQLNVGGITAILNNTASTSTTTGALTVAGGEGVAGDLNVGGLTGLKNTTQSTSNTTGALTVAGGAGIVGNLNVGGAVSFGGASAFGGKLAISDATSSTSTTTGALTVVGGTGIGENLNVGGIGKILNSTTSTSASTGAFVVTGGTGIGENLNVGGIAKMLNSATSSSASTGALVVTGGTGIGENLNVGGVAKMLNSTTSTSASTGALVVIGGTGIGENLSVAGVAKMLNNASSTSSTTGALIVSGGTGIAENLNVGGKATVEGLTTINDQLKVTSSVADGEFLATFTNTDNSKGDGIKIKLGKAKSVYSPPTISSGISDAQATKMKNLISCSYSGNRLDLLGDIVLTATEDDAKAIAGLAVGVGNIIIGQLNTLLDLPINIGPYSTPAQHIWNSTTIFGGLDLGALGSIPSLTIPALDIPKVEVLPKTEVMPKLPTIDLTGIGVPDINIADLSFWGIPTDLCLEDAVGSTPMNNDNEFIRFADKNDAKMGTIRAVSVTNWSTNYLNPAFMYSLYGALTSSKVDKFHAQYHFKAEITAALKNYATLGVEYASGNGDYAEWLERADGLELITAGDIVAVNAGKITKNLDHAEQVMVVSHNPIVLGNVPAEGRTKMGNNIAFMGQVPVKVLGPVVSGDYIVAQSATPGFGLAVHPDNMTIEDFKYAVGRSWDNDLLDGPKMVNTVVGVHNGDYLKVLKKFESKVNDSQIRLQKLEAKVDDLAKVKSSADAAKH